MAHTTIKVDDDVWRRVRYQAIKENKRVSEMLEEILREHFEEVEE